MSDETAQRTSKDIVAQLRDPFLWERDNVEIRSKAAAEIEWLSAELRLAESARAYANDMLDRERQRAAHETFARQPGDCRHERASVKCPRPRIELVTVKDGVVIACKSCAGHWFLSNTLLESRRTGDPNLYMPPDESPVRNK